MTDEGGTPVPGLPSAIQPVKTNRFKAWVAGHRKLLLIVVPIVALVILAAIFWFATANQPAAQTTVTSTPKPTPPVKVASPLTGVLVDPSAAKQPLAAVMIENLYPDARPQSGLSEAGIVYEALAEGGITRFLAIFQEPFPTVIGPVRSLRPYYLDWGLEYNIPIAHAGGSQPALDRIGPSGLKNIEALVQSSGFYRATDRLAPHNLYTKTTLLAALLTKLKFDTAPTFTGYTRKDDTPPATGVAPLHPKISISFGVAAAYNVQYDYDLATNSYKRSNGGAPQLDRNTNTQISVKNVVVEFVPVTYFTQPDGKPATDYKIIGSGKAYFFEDGNAVVGTWSKTSDSAPTQLLDAAGLPVKFDRGNTWFSVIPATNTVTY